MAQPQVQIITGPSATSVSLSAAEDSLKRFASANNAEVAAIETVAGHWVAALIQKEADLPFGGPADSDEEAPGPKSEGPGDTAPDDSGDGGDDGPPSPDSGGDSSDGPPSDGDSDKSKGKGGEKHELHQIIQVLEAFGQALGVDVSSIIGSGDPTDPSGGDPLGGGDPMGGPPVPGATPPPPPGAGGPPGMGGGGPGGHPDHQVIQHQKSLKPGEVPPGATAAGAPAFASVRSDHPWADAIGKIASFHVSRPLGDKTAVEAEAEIQQLAAETEGYRVASFEEAFDSDGQRVATAVITAH